METPPASEFAAARLRHQEALVAFEPGTVTIGGTDYDGQVWIGEQGLEQTDEALRVVQRFAATIAKSDLATEPVRGTTVLIGGEGFKLLEVGGQNDYDQAWILKGMRIPGADA